MVFVFQKNALVLKGYTPIALSIFVNHGSSSMYRVLTLFTTLLYLTLCSSAQFNPRVTVVCNNHCYQDDQYRAVREERYFPKSSHIIHYRGGANSNVPYFGSTTSDNPTKADPSGPLTDPLPLNIPPYTHSVGQSPNSDPALQVNYAVNGGHKSINRGILFGKKSSFIHTYFTNALVQLIRDPHLINFSAQVLSSLVWVTTLLSVLGTVGVDTKPMVALLGIAGVIFGLVTKDLLADIGASFALLYVQPFSHGDMISVCNYKGKVQSFGVHYVELFDSEQLCTILVPLSIVLNNAIRVYKSST